MTSTLPAEPPAVVPTSTAPGDPAGRPVPRSWAARLGRGCPADHPLVRPALLALLAGTAVLYSWGLSASGWANSYYAAATQAAATSWKAFFFGSFDAGNFITVDKTPASLWAPALAARVFGLNSWSLLVPQALMGVATVGLLYLTVRRWYGAGAGLLAGAGLALTPVAVLMFRFNNPDALLVLLLVAGAYTTVRAVETGATRWLACTGVLVGFGFLAKMLQSLLVVPAFAVVYLIAGPPKLGRRVLQLLVAGAALVVSAGWYIAVVELVPASARPYVGGSQHNSLLELTLGYNGLGRLSGDEPGSVGGRLGWGSPGWTRMFDAAQGGQVAWLLPAALVALLVGSVVTARSARTDRLRAGFLLWGGWLLTTSLVFSFMQGIFHPYYTVALAPAVAALVGMGAATLWRVRRHPAAALVLGVAIAVTAWWGYHLLDRSPGWLPWLRWAVLIAGLGAAAGLLASFRLPARVAAGAAVAAVAAALAGPAAYAAQTAGTGQHTANPMAGPAVLGAGGGPRTFPGGAGPGGTGPGGTGPGAGRMPAGGNPPAGADGPAGAPATGGVRRGMGGLLSGPRPTADLVALLRTGADSFTWAAAAVGGMNAAGYQLGSGEPVLAIGGFNGSDPAPTLAQFRQLVAERKVHYFIGGGGFRGGPGAGAGAGSQIAGWVTSTFTPTTVGGVTVYDLTAR